MFEKLLHHHHTKRKVYEIPFEFEFANGHKAVTLGFVWALGEHQAMTRLTFELEHHQRRFIKLVSDIKAIDIDSWNDYARHNAPDFAANMPKADELLTHLDAKVFFLPSIEVKGPLE